MAKPTMIECPTCQHKVSVSANTCPSCGAVLRKPKRGFFGKLTVFAFVDAPAVFRSIDIRAEGREPGLIQNTDQVLVTFEIEVREPVRDLRLSVGVCTESGEMIFATGTPDSSLIFEQAKRTWVLQLHLPKLMFLSRQYSLTSSLWAPSAGVFDRVDDTRFTVEASPTSPLRIEGRLGQITVPAFWKEVA